jgi:hypothetical protein
MEDGRGLLAWYSRMLDTHPILTKSVSSAVYWRFWWHRVATCSGPEWETTLCIGCGSHLFPFGFLGLVLIGPVIHVWYGSASRWFPGQSASAVIKRVALDQIFFQSHVSPDISFRIMAAWRQGFQSGAFGFEAHTPTVIVAVSGALGPAQIINFRFVPGKYQVLFSNFVGFVWNAHRSYTAHSDDQERLVGKASKQID